MKRETWNQVGLTEVDVDRAADSAPDFVFRDAGVELTLASPKGGQPPIDPKSDLPENQTSAMTRFEQDAQAQKALSQTVTRSDMKTENFDTVFYVGGHGPMWDLVNNPDYILANLSQPFVTRRLSFIA